MNFVKNFMFLFRKWKKKQFQAKKIFFLKFLEIEKSSNKMHFISTEFHGTDCYDHDSIANIMILVSLS